MATQAYIIAQEFFIIEAGKDAKSGKEFPVEMIRTVLEDVALSYQYECRINGGSCYRENRDCWGTLGVNSSFLGRHCPELADECRTLCNLLGTS